MFVYQHYLKNKNEKIQLLIASLATISLLSCDKKALDIKFDAPVQEFNVTFSPTNGAKLIDTTKIITIPNLEQKAKDNGVSDISFIKSVTITKITATLADSVAPHLNCDSLISGSLEVSAPTANPPIAAINVGSFTVPKNVTSFSVTPTSENYIVFSKQSEIQYRIKLNARKIEKPVKVKFKVESQAIANPTK